MNQSTLATTDINQILLHLALASKFILKSPSGTPKWAASPGHAALAHILLTISHSLPDTADSAFTLGALER